MTNGKCDRFLQHVHMRNSFIDTATRKATDSDYSARVQFNIIRYLVDYISGVFTCNQPNVLNIKSVLFARLRYASNLINVLVI